MSTLLSAQSLSFDLSSGPLLEDISFTLKSGDRIGLIGHNGCGKSTLLKLLWGELSPRSGSVSQSHQCLMARVEQYLPVELDSVSLLDAVLAQIPENQRLSESWRAEFLLSDMGFCELDWSLAAATLSGGQHTRLLLARALISEPDLLLLDEPSNHLDLPTLLWLEQFLNRWSGSFVLVSHDQRLLDKVTNSTWILRDQTLSFFRLPCSQARQALDEKDEADAHRHQSEQKEIDRIEKSAKRLAVWGQVYDDERFARKARNMGRRADRLKEEQTELSDGSPWELKLSGEAMKADRLLVITAVDIKPAQDAPPLFHIMEKQIKSGDRIALVGQNGSGKSSLLRQLWLAYQQSSQENSQQQTEMLFHPRNRVGYYDQNQQQLRDQDTLLDALRHFAPLPDEERKMSLISAGFPYHRHAQQVQELSGGERSRLLFVGLTLANYHMLFLDEPTNHLDLEGKDELAETLAAFAGGFLLVTHDRDLIEKGCNRFWLIKNNKLEEWLDLEALYQTLGEEPSNDQKPSVISLSDDSLSCDAESATVSDEDDLLARLIELETKLEQDLAQKEKRQKPKLQQAWQSEIQQLQSQLGLH